jgi:uncharacterized tellurite resistance protein B-like protein
MPITTIIDRLVSLASRSETGGTDGDVATALSSLLAEAALMDGSLDEGEVQRIVALLGKRFALGTEEAAQLLAKGRAAAEGSTQLYGFTRTLKDALSPEQRIDVIEMLWEVAYADGVLHDYEANLIRRVGGLLFVSDHEAGAARKRAMARLRQSDGLA